MSYLSLESLQKRFKRETVLDGLSLSVQRGETVVIFGPSGCGKTVLLRLIAGVNDLDAGDIKVGGESIVDLAPEARGVGMAFQNFALYPHMTAFENIASPLRAGRAADAETRQRVNKLAELLKIDHVLQHLPRELSNGQKQRTALARSLARAPSVLLLDDPLRNVDAKLRYEMRLELPRLLREFEATALYVTQDYKEAMALGDRIGVLLDGRFSQIERPEAIYRTPANLEIARLFGDPTINLYPCRPSEGPGGLGVDLFGIRLALDPSLAAAAGRDCILGIRPEHVHVALEGDETAMPVELDAVMPLNIRAVLLLKTPDGQEILASCTEEEAARFPRGHRAVWAHIDMTQALLFEADSGNRIAPGLK